MMAFSMTVPRCLSQDKLGPDCFRTASLSLKNGFGIPVECIHGLPGPCRQRDTVKDRGTRSVPPAHPGWRPCRWRRRTLQVARRTGWRATSGGSGVIHNPGGVCVLFQRRRGPRFNIATTREQAMRNRKAEVNADIEARIAQIQQMTLNQIGAFQCRILTEITNGRIAPREASALDRALRKRLKAIEQQLREGG
jgi:hypothetical protein